MGERGGDVVGLMEGVLILVVVLGAATAFGVWRRRTDGRMQHVAVAEGPPLGPPVPATAPGAAAGLPAGGDAPSAGGAPPLGDDSPAGDDSPVAEGPLAADDVSEPLVVDGRPVTIDHTLVPAAHRLTAEDLGTPLGARATLVQFSSAFCQPCRATRVVLGDVAGMVAGVTHVEVDAESHLELVRRLDITRTPTVLVLDAAGRIRRRATGAPRRADVIAAIGEVA
jgi:thiol-disulfide isomerase/thioredoxin